MQNVIISIAEIFERIKSVTGAKNDADVARLLGVPPKKLAVWKLRNTIPYEEVIAFCRDHDLNLEWVLLGAGLARKRISDPTAYIQGYAYEQDHEEVHISAGYVPGVGEPLVLIDEPEANIYPEMAIKIINELLGTMSDDQKRDVLKYVEERKLIAELMAEKRSKKKREGDLHPRKGR